MAPHFHPHPHQHQSSSFCIVCRYSQAHVGTCNPCSSHDGLRCASLPPRPSEHLPKGGARCGSRTRTAPRDGPHAHARRQQQCGCHGKQGRSMLHTAVARRTRLGRHGPAGASAARAPCRLSTSDACNAFESTALQCHSLVARGGTARAPRGNAPRPLVVLRCTAGLRARQQSHQQHPRWRLEDALVKLLHATQ